MHSKALTSSSYMTLLLLQYVKVGIYTKTMQLQKKNDAELKPGSLTSEQYNHRAKCRRAGTHL